MSIGISVLLLGVVLLMQVMQQPTPSSNIQPVQAGTEISTNVEINVKAQAPNQQLSGAQKRAINQALFSNNEQVPDEVLAQLPLSLQGAPLPSALAVHDDGTLVIAIAVRHYFDYFLTGIGEEPLTIIVARVKYQLTEQLDEPALSTALDMFSSYLAYRDELAKLLHAGEQDYANLRAQIKASRNNHFDGQTVEAFFALEDSYDDYMQKRSALNTDTSLSALQKRQQAEQLLESAPMWLQQQHHKANQLNDFYSAQAKLIAVGASQTQVQQLRELSFGIEAADRLAALDQKREIWQQKLSEYHQQVSDLLAANMNGDMLSVELSLLRRQHFNDSEVLRVQAIDSNKFDGLL